MAEINLLPTEERAHERFVLLVKRFSVVSVVILVLTGLLTLATLGFFTSLSSKRSQLVARVEDASAQINDLKATEELIVVVKEKAADGDRLLSARLDQAKIFEKLAQIVPQGVYFTDIKFSSDKSAISGKAKSSADVAGFIASLLGAEGSKIINQVSVDSLSSDEAGVYTFALSGQLVKQ